MKKRKCLHCKEYFPMEDSIRCNSGWFCSIEHMKDYGLKKSRMAAERARKKAERAEKKAHNQRKRKLFDEDRSKQLKKTQQIFNNYIRLRDSNAGCISCGRNHNGQYHAGHYRTVGANPSLRFEPSNCHKQCSPCNNHLSGNITEYRINLVNKIGSSRVAWLEGPHKPKRYTIANLKTIQKWYTRKIKRLERENEKACTH